MPKGLNFDTRLRENSHGTIEEAFLESSKLFLNTWSWSALDACRKLLSICQRVCFGSAYVVSILRFRLTKGLTCTLKERLFLQRTLVPQNLQRTMILKQNTLLQKLDLNFGVHTTLNLRETHQALINLVWNLDQVHGEV